jgi:peptide subunit release factor 1 (eRF1)
VLTLVVTEGFQTSGYSCPVCKALAAVRECPACGGRSEPVQDVVELAVSTVLRQGGEIEILNQNVDLE